MGGQERQFSGQYSGLVGLAASRRRFGSTTHRHRRGGAYGSLPSTMYANLLYALKPYRRRRARAAHPAQRGLGVYTILCTTLYTVYTQGQAIQSIFDTSSEKTGKAASGSSEPRGVGCGRAAIERRTVTPRAPGRSSEETEDRHEESRRDRTEQAVVFTR